MNLVPNKMTKREGLDNEKGLEFMRGKLKSSIQVVPAYPETNFHPIPLENLRSPYI